MAPALRKAGAMAAVRPANGDGQDESSVSSPESATALPLFPKLPAELRIEVWKNAAYTDRTSVHFFTVIPRKMMSIIGGYGRWSNRDELICLCTAEWMRKHMRRDPYPGVDPDPTFGQLQKLPVSSHSGYHERRWISQVSTEARAVVEEAIRRRGSLKVLQQYNGTSVTIDGANDIVYLGFLQFTKVNDLVRLRQETKHYRSRRLKHSRKPVEVNSTPSQPAPFPTWYCQRIPDRSMVSRALEFATRRGFDVFTGVRRLALELDLEHLPRTLCTYYSPHQAEDGKCYVCGDDWHANVWPRMTISRRYSWFLRRFPDLEAVYFVFSDNGAINKLRRVHDPGQKRRLRRYFSSETTPPHDLLNYTPIKVSADRIEKPCLHAPSDYTLETYRCGGGILTELEAPLHFFELLHYNVIQRIRRGYLDGEHFNQRLEALDQAERERITCRRSKVTFKVMRWLPDDGAKP